MDPDAPDPDAPEPDVPLVEAAAAEQPAAHEPVADEPAAEEAAAEEPAAEEEAAEEAAEEEAAARPVPRWGLGDVILGLVVGLVLSSVLASIWLGFTGDEELSIGGKAFSQMGLWIGLVGGPVVAARRKGSGSLATDFGWRFRWVDVALGAAVALVALLVIVPAVGLLLRPLLGDPDVSQPVTDLVDEAHGPALIGLVLIAVVGAPLVEELFFRGLLLRSIEKSVGTGWAIAGSSVFFGLSHPNNLPADAQILVMVALAALAVALSTVAVKTRRLGPSIVAHALFNAVNLAVAIAAK
jgi:membrane protease YdiL (CAAX protease family)